MEGDLERRRRERLRESLRNPHPESEEWEALGFAEWAATADPAEAELLLDPSRGRPVRWMPGQGWLEP